MSCARSRIWCCVLYGTCSKWWFGQLGDYARRRQRLGWRGSAVNGAVESRGGIESSSLRVDGNSVDSDLNCDRKWPAEIGTVWG